jgi:hypothetical protein
MRRHTLENATVSQFIRTSYSCEYVCKVNNKLWEEKIAYFPLLHTDRIENDAYNSFSLPRESLRQDVTRRIGSHTRSTILIFFCIYSLPRERDLRAIA